MPSLDLEWKGEIMKKAGLMCLAVATAISMPAVAADKLDIGKIEYDQSCATCHGLDGLGKGSVSEVLQLSMPDITTLAKRNGGIFPATRVYDVIDGREMVKAHGTREMPIWGKHYSTNAAPR